MFQDNYPLIYDLVNGIQDKEKFCDNINSIKFNSCNIIYITDYEITTKISQHYLNENIPISRNSNSVCIRHFLASYIYHLTNYILIGLKTIQCLGNGEYTVKSDYIIDLVSELDMFVTTIYQKNMNDDPLNQIKSIFNTLIKQEEPEENLTCEKSAFRRNSSDSNGVIEKLEPINTSYYEKELFIDQIESSDESDGDSETYSKTSNECINDIKENLVNILAN